jgi:predicted oxidoreductase
VTNQLEISLLHPDLLVAGTAVNQRAPEHVLRNEGTLEYCRENGITVQAWSPMAKGLLSGAEISGEPEHVRSAAMLVAELAEEKGVSKEAIVLAWLLEHPAPILPVVGTTNPRRIAAAAEAERAHLTREEWYLLLEESRRLSMP